MYPIISKYKFVEGIRDTFNTLFFLPFIGIILKGILRRNDNIQFSIDSMHELISFDLLWVLASQSY